MTLWSDPNHIAIRRQPVFIVTGQVHVLREGVRERNSSEFQHAKSEASFAELVLGRVVLSDMNSRARALTAGLTRPPAVRRLRPVTHELIGRDPAVEARTGLPLPRGQGAEPHKGWQRGVA